jgi:hypothetical protein
MLAVDRSEPHRRDAPPVCPGGNLNGLAHEAVVLSVFGDESSDETKQRVFVVGGLLGDTQQWDGLAPKWNETTGGRIFHAAECESGYGDFRGLSEETRHRLHRDLTRVLAESGLIGWGAAIDLKAATANFPEMLPHQPRFSCFVRVIQHFASVGSQCIPRDSLEFTFDQHPETQYNSGLLYNYMATEWTDEPAFLAEKISFASRKYVGIQAADLWAREMMKRFDSFIRDDRSTPRLQWQMLRETNRFYGEFICSGYFEDFKARYDSISAEVGMNQNEYQEWLVRKRRQDNQTNRIEYMMMVDALERAGKTEEAS